MLGQPCGVRGGEGIPSGQASHPAISGTGHQACLPDRADVSSTCPAPPCLSHHIPPGQVAFRMIKCSEFEKSKAGTRVLPAAAPLPFLWGTEEVSLSYLALFLLTLKLGGRYKFRWGNTFTETWLWLLQKWLAVKYRTLD